MSALNQNELDLTSFRALALRFATLEAVDEGRARGEYRAQFVGPWWFRNTAWIGVAIAGLSGWRGKRILGKGRAVNLVKPCCRKESEGLQESVPMLADMLVSRLDSKPSLTFSYPKSSPLLLQRFIDELRQLDEQTILAMTIVDLPIIRRWPFPFLLHRVTSVDA